MTPSEGEAMRTLEIRKAFNDWSWEKEGIPIGTMLPNEAAREGFYAGIAYTLRTLPLSPVDREQVAAIIYVKRFPHRTWATASLDETKMAYEQADAILALSRPLSGGQHDV